MNKSNDVSHRLRWSVGTHPYYSMEGIAFAAIGSLCVVQLTSTWLSAKLISTLTIGKMVLVAAICLMGIVDQLILENDTGQLAYPQSFNNTSTVPGNWVLAFANCMFSFNGWNSLNLAAAEIREPAVTIPLAIPLSLLIVTVSYLWINIAYFTSMPMDVISGTQSVATTFSNLVVGKIFTKFITAGVALSAFATCNGSLFAGAQAVRESGTVFTETLIVLAELIFHLYRED